MSPAPGTRLRAGRYLLLGRLREGGTATIWRAVDTRERAERALKAIPLDTDGARVAELEAEVSARVAHRGVVRVHASFVEAGHGWVVMERAAGSLADAVEAHGPLDGTLLRRVALDLCDALAAAHAAGVVHRDIKPQNVLVHADGRVQLADFGIAQVHARGHTRTRTGAVLGTLPFMAPEQRRDPRAVRPATDVYALAALLAWARCGQAAGELYVPSATARLRAELRAAGEPDDALLELLAAAGAYDPDERPADGSALLRRLQALPGTVAADTSALAGRVAALEAPEERGERAPEDVAPAGASEAGALRGRPEAPPQEGSEGWVRPAALLSAAVILSTGTFALGTRYPTRSVDPTTTAPAPGQCATTWRFPTSQRVLAPREAIDVTTGDLDIDGHPDVVFANQLDESLSIYWGDGTARLGEPQILSVGRVSAAPAIGDIDGDGRPDLLVPDADRSEVRTLTQRDARVFQGGIPIEQQALQPGRAVSLVRWYDDEAADLLLSLDGGTVLRNGLGGGRFDTRQLQVSDNRRATRPLMRQSGRAELVVRESDAVEVLARDASGLARRVSRWEVAVDEVLPYGAQLLAVAGHALLELSDDGSVCVRSAAVPMLRAVVDMDADGVPEGLFSDTCSGCTSNHVLVRGVTESG